MAEKEKPTGLALLREPFPANQISKLPKPTKKQTDDVKADYRKGIRCKICGGWHHPDVVHLDYVGHAALTDRLLDADPSWNWEPLAFSDKGTPAIDENGGMWIKLTVCGVTRMGYGHPDGKRGGDAVKEVIGDALRNAAMRFGAALDLWHKGDLHALDDADSPTGSQEAQKPAPRQQPKQTAPDPQVIENACGYAKDAETLEELQRVWGNFKALQNVREFKVAVNLRKRELEAPAIPEDEDHIPYEGK